MSLVRQNKIDCFCDDVLFVVPHPEIIQAPLNLTVKPGNEANFSCLAFSHSMVKYEWKFNEHKNLPTNSEVFMQGDTMIYFINNTRPSFEGFYCCVATNEVGSVQECAWLEVDSKSLELHYSTAQTQVTISCTSAL